MADPQIVVTGPFDDGSPAEGSLALYNTQDATDSADTDVEQESIPTQDDEEVILSPISGRRDLNYSGDVSGIRLMNAGFGNDPYEAAVNYLFRLESLVLAEQGQGYRVEDATRQDTYEPQFGGDGDITDPGVLFDTVRWEQESGEPIDLEWTVNGKITEGLQEARRRSSYISDQESAYDPNITRDTLRTEDGEIEFDLGEVESRRYERELGLDVMDMIHQFDVPNIGVIESGVEGEFEVDGRITSEQVDDLAEIARLLTDDIHGRQVVIEDSFTRRRFSGAVDDSDTTFEAGVPNVLDYRVVLTIGDNVVSE